MATPATGGELVKKIFAVLIACVIALGLTGSTAFADPANVGKAQIVEYGWNAPGKDTTGNRNAEFIRIKNVTAAALDVEGWTVHDGYQTAGGDWGNRYTLRATGLPDGSPFKVGDPARFVIPAGAHVFVYSGAGLDSTPTNTTAAIYRNFKHHLNNAGDSIFVRDADGVVVHKITYTSYRAKLY